MGGWYTFYTFMEFEFDPLKSERNKKKHGIDFVEAQELWADEDRLEVPANTGDEPPYVLIAQYRESIWTAIFTYRGERVRLISVRRARQQEKELYYESEASRSIVR